MSQNEVILSKHLVVKNFMMMEKKYLLTLFINKMLISSVPFAKESNETVEYH